MKGERDAYHLVELGHEDLDVAQHRTARAVAREVRLRPDVPVRAVPLLLVLQVEARDGRVVAALLRHVAHARFRRIHHAREGLADDRVVRLLAALVVRNDGRGDVGLVVPARQVPLQNQHEPLVRVVSLETTRLGKAGKQNSGESRISMCISISPRCSRSERGERKNTGMRTRVRSWPTHQRYSEGTTRLQRFQDVHEQTRLDVGLSTDFASAYVLWIFASPNGINDYPLRCTLRIRYLRWYREGRLVSLPRPWFGLHRALVHSTAIPHATLK